MSLEYLLAIVLILIIAAIFFLAYNSGDIWRKFRGLPAGLDFRNTPSLGLQLVVTLAEQLAGKIELPEGSGTAYRITFERATAR